MHYRDPALNPSVANKLIKQTGVRYERNPDAEYGEHIRNTTAICNTSASHTYGNVLSLVEKYLLDIFPQDLFKTVTASTALVSKQLTHLPHQLHKKEMPIMVLMPRIEFGQDDRFLGNTLMNSRVNNIHSVYGDGSLIPLATDARKKIYVHGHYNRAVMYIDIVLSFNTYTEQINYLSYIHNMIPIGHPQFIRAPLELYLPESFCTLLGNLAGLQIEKDDKSISEFLTYMNSIWYHPITYKLKGASNSNEFFMYYIADIDTTISNVQAGSGVKDGQIRRAFDISFTVKCEFNTIGYFNVSNPNITKQIHLANEENGAIVPLFSDVINLDDFQLPIGWILLSWPIFKLKEGESTISIDPILNQSLRAVIDYHLQLGIPMERFINIQFRENGEILNDELFYIDWHERILHILHPNHRRTYRLIVAVSNDYINNLVKQIYELE